MRTDTSQRSSFDLSGIPDDAFVEKATLHAYVTGCLTLTNNTCPAGSHQLSATGLVEEWSRSSSPWPAPEAAEEDDAVATVPTGAPSGWRSWDITPMLVELWTAGDDEGVMIDRLSTSLGSGGVKLAGKDHANAGERPYVEIDYYPDDAWFAEPEEGEDASTVCFATSRELSSGLEVRRQRTSMVRQLPLRARRREAMSKATLETRRTGVEE